MKKSKRKTTSGVLVRHTNKGHLLSLQGYCETSQPNPLNNHQPRMGTKRNASTHHCPCEYCNGHSEKNKTLTDIVKKEVNQEIEENV